MNRMILGRKIGMSQIFTEGGKRIPVTVVQVGPMTIIGKKSTDGKDGYNAVKVGFEPAARQEKDGNVRYRGLTKAEVGVFKHADIETPFRIVREFHCSDAQLASYEVGSTIDHSAFREGEFVDVSATSKGKGTAGVMKRHNFSGFKASHGVHETHRGSGSVGASAYPARTFPGTRMAGRMGNERVTVQNLKLVQIDTEDGLFLIQGAVPGGRNALVRITPALKKNQR
jgi:large subunit ribosomal protein L3